VRYVLAIWWQVAGLAVAVDFVVFIVIGLGYLRPEAVFRLYICIRVSRAVAYSSNLFSKV
jgi:hypothetical protein